MWWIIFLFIIYVVCSSLWRTGGSILKLILKPIADFVYQTILDILKEAGMEERVAKALISLMIIAIVVIIIGILF